MFILAALSGCARPTPLPVAPAAAPEPAPAPRVVFLVRHAEKERDGSEDPRLTEAGAARARCLADVLAPFAPEVLLASPYTRTQSTLAPLAEVVGRSPEILDAGEIDAWVARLRALPPGGHGVVAGHSNTVPAIVAGLGGHLTGLDEKGWIPDDTFDRLVEVVLDADGRAVSTFHLVVCNSPAPGLEPAP